MTAHERLQKALATLSAVWGENASRVAERLNIVIDASNIQPAELGPRARRAMARVAKEALGKKVAKGYERAARREVSEATATMLSDEKTFKKLRKELMLFVKSRLNAERFEIEDIVSETMYAVLFYEVSSYSELEAKSKNIARIRVNEFLRSKYRNPAVAAPQEDFFIIEEVYALIDDEEPSHSTDYAPTSDLEEAFRRAAAELVRLMGVQQAAVAVGMREKTFRALINN